ncbi:hypothetical protein AB5N19_03565 [Seiridium cardinale]
MEPNDQGFDYYNMAMDIHQLLEENYDVETFDMVTFHPLKIEATLSGYGSKDSEQKDAKIRKEIEEYVEKHLGGTEIELILEGSSRNKQLMLEGSSD